MGRYAQRARRGGGPPAGSAAPPITVTSVVFISSGGGESSVEIFFSQDVSFNANPPDGSFVINGTSQATIAVQGASNSGLLTMDAESTIGDPWSLVGSPPWLEEVVQAPAAGVLV